MRFKTLQIVGNDNFHMTHDFVKYTWIVINIIIYYSYFHPENNDLAFTIIILDIIVY